MLGSVVGCSTLFRGGMGLNPKSKTSFFDNKEREFSSVSKKKREKQSVCCNDDSIFQHTLDITCPADLASSLKEQQRQRRIDRNAWNDSFIQFLSSPFLDPSYSILAEQLTLEIKEEMKKVFVESEETNNVIVRLSMIDCLVCLGIDRLFEEEIKQALDFVYANSWNENSGVGEGTASSMPDLLSTSLAFRLLRLYRYPNISANIFTHFRSHGGGSFLPEETNSSIFTKKSMMKALNLMRASYLQFPGEIILEEVQTSCVSFLNNFLCLETSTEMERLGLMKEVRHALKYHWHLTTPRWEARNFIDFYSIKKDWLRSDLNKNILEMAKLDYNILQAKYQEDLKEVSRWWNNSEVSKLSSFRHRPIESYLIGVSLIFEPHLSDVRILIAKVGLIMYVMDDMYDTYANREELPLITNALKRLEVDVIDRQSMKEEIIKGTKFCIESICEIIRELSDKQGFDTYTYISERSLESAHAHELGAIWNFEGHVPSFEEYERIGNKSIAMFPIFISAKLGLYNGFPVPDLETTSRIDRLCAWSCRLFDDINDFEEEKKHGEYISAVECYANDHPEFTLQETIGYLQVMERDLMKKIIQEYLDPEYTTIMKGDTNDLKKVINWKKTTLEITRSFHFSYSYGDGLTTNNKGWINLISLLLFQQIE